MKHLYIVGIGTGNPEHLTLQAINALNQADVLFIPTKGSKKAELADLRREICERYVTRADSRIVEYAVAPRETAERSYLQSVAEWHAGIAATYEGLLVEELAADGIGAFLVWGDPSLYDSTLRIVERVKAAGRIDFDYTVIPGITSIQALAASHRIAINTIGGPVQITTGRRLAESFPKRAPSAIVMLDGEQAFGKLDEPDAEIFWGAYLGTDDEIIVSGRLADVADKIVKARTEARARHGWIMDIYLLRKGGEPEE